MRDTISNHYVQDVKKLVYELALKACRKQVLVFSKELKGKMLQNGISKADINDIISTAFQGYSTMEAFKEHCSTEMLSILDAYIRPNNRGRDALGRLIIEFGVVRSFKSQVLFPDGSRQDDAARKSFVKGVVARPLMRYFLVAVRGTIRNLDDFEAKPILFSEHNEDMALHRQDIDSLVEDFTKEFNYGKTFTEWQRLYEDKRVLNIIFDVLDSIVQNMHSLGPKRFLKIINNIQNADKNAGTRTGMKRLFHLNDIRQLSTALDRGHAALAAQLGVELPD